MNSIVVNLMQVRQRIELAALAAKREPEDIELLAVSKTFPASAIEEAMHAEQSAFGENYVQEGIEKIIQLEISPEEAADISIKFIFARFNKNE